MCLSEKSSSKTLQFKSGRADKDLLIHEKSFPLKAVVYAFYDKRKVNALSKQMEQISQVMVRFQKKYQSNNTRIPTFSLCNIYVNWVVQEKSQLMNFCTVVANV